MELNDFCMLVQLYTNEKVIESEEWTDGINLFLHVNTWSQKLKTDQNFLEWTWSKMGVASLVMGLENWLYLKNELME